MPTPSWPGCRDPRSWSAMRPSLHRFARPTRTTITCSRWRPSNEQNSSVGMGICSRWPATIPLRGRRTSSQRSLAQTTDHEDELELLNGTAASAFGAPSRVRLRHLNQQPGSRRDLVSQLESVASTPLAPTITNNFREGSRHGVGEALGRALTSPPSTRSGAPADLRPRPGALPHLLHLERGVSRPAT